ncbi:transposase [Actomonas aquatica]|uniref:Transposase n=1 Tax=Actomonas aquatica TaxID=2866162 RepID=A0ABZ1C223_9BACT|nr:transposase [Opitutus sp. WL0086]WRQ85721.1 transposase [Opitutus sp. WL0086]
MINRGNYRSSIFGGKGAAEAFERVLDLAAERYAWRVHAYVVMRNHFHLAIELTEPNLSEGMKWLQGTWIRRFNAIRTQIGRPFQGRYKALLVEPGDAFGRVCHYIHLNPVRAKVVSATEASSYRPGSLAKFADKKQRPAWLDPSTVLDTAGGLKDTARGWRCYGEYLEFLAEDAVAKKELVAKKMSRGWCLGSFEFKKQQLEEMKERGAELERFKGSGAGELRKEREQVWEDRLVALAASARIDLGKLGKRKSAPEKVLLAAVLKQSTSVSNGWLATRLEMGQAASASQFVRRLLLQKEGRGAVERLLSRVKT